MEMERTI